LGVGQATKRKWPSSAKQTPKWSDQNKYPKRGAFFNHHTFTTIFTTFTMEKTMFCTPFFAKPPAKTRKHHAEKKYARQTRF